MKPELLKELESQVVVIAQQAGATVLEIYHKKSFKVIKKADLSPVTEADFAANTIITQELGKLKNQYPVLSEEACVDFEQRKHWQTYWLVDPLDGTKEFIKKNGEFGINIALVHNNQAVLGVVHAPVFNKTYVASKKNGAWKTKDGVVKPLQTSKASEPKRITFSRSHLNFSTRMQNYLAKLGKTKVVRMGSSLKSCLVAEGRADLYPRMGATCEWDTAACQIIVEQAGGVLCDLQGKPLSYNTKESLINPEFIVYGDKDVKWLLE